MARFICTSGWYFLFGLTKLGSCSAGARNGGAEPGGLTIPRGGGGGGGGPEPNGSSNGAGGIMPLMPVGSGGAPEPRDALMAAPTP